MDAFQKAIKFREDRVEFLRSAYAFLEKWHKCASPDDGRAYPIDPFIKHKKLLISTFGKKAKRFYEES